DDGELEDLADVALLHDIGKVGVPDAVLRKPGPLSDDEWRAMREHPAIGAAIVERVAQLAHLAPAIRAEHERWDGEGYPDGLAGESIPVASRIVLACDGYHAMVSERPYRRAMPRADALAELRRCAGTMFWPPAVEALIGVVGRS
ncbi:MAG TPA: HD domain-containing phosphohydrolase, partial [Capillimicrobium sp.]